MLHSLEQTKIKSLDKSLVQSIALVVLLGFELSYYLLIVQTGLAQHYHSDLISLFPLFMGGVAGTIISGQQWGKISNPMHKMMIALSLQLVLSFMYPNFNPFTLGLLGLSVGMMAPLSIYIFKEHQRSELFFALAIAYSVGTFLFTSYAEERTLMAIVFTLLALGSTFVLRAYVVEQEHKNRSRSFLMYLPLMLWILLDSNLFETLSRHEGLDIWSHQTYTIMIFHLLGLAGAYFLRISELKQHLFIALLLGGSYLLSYLEMPIALAMLYPFAISYYNVIVFSILTKEMSLNKLSCIMVFIGWIASGIGLAIALSGLLH